NKPPQGQPDLWCRWRLDPDSTTLRYTATRNLFLCSAWLQYLLDHFLLPWGYQLDGEIFWQGDDAADRGSIIVKASIIEHHLQQEKRRTQLALPHEPILCVHHDAQETRLVCQHLAGQNPESSYSQWFTGNGQHYDLICQQCTTNVKAGETSLELRQICWRCYKELHEEGDWEGIAGRPEIVARSPALSMTQQHIPFPLTVPFLDLQPINTSSESVWIALTSAGDLVRLNLTTQIVTHLMHLPDSQLDRTQQVSLHLAPNADCAAIVNTHGQYGIVVNLNTGAMTMPLERDTYHIEHSVFPLAFFEYNDRQFLVHGTEWNRLDISDPGTGELISKRPTPFYQREYPGSEHYLDYFHAGLSVSPHQEWIADNGWVWQPVGIVTTWDLRCWLQENVWESEDGSSHRSLCQRDYFWDGPLCWIDGQTLAVWGYGEDDEWLIPAIRLFDVRTGKETGWFAGPEKGTLVFDEYLFSLSQEHGVSAWDVSTGERIGAFPDFRPTHYHQGAKQFLRVDAQKDIALEIQEFLIKDGKILLRKTEE
ncbi:MAG TPA: hypothetical protein VII61_06150, partial [Ktedonobacteraceae bacterium]